MNDDPTPLAACLRTVAGEPVPLKGVSISGDVFGGQARIVLRQRYRNDEARPVEAIYTFPAPSDAALAGFVLEGGGRRLEAEVLEREEAFLRYDDALMAGHGAALLEQERKNVFTASVGNLLPGEEVTVEITYVQRLYGDEGALRLVVPTLVAPRYVPGVSSGARTGHGALGPTDRVPDADRISPKLGPVAYGVSLDLAFDFGAPVDIASPSHAVVVRDGGGGEGRTQRRVSFAASEVALDRDIVLVARAPAGATLGLAASRGDRSDGTFALTIVPDLLDPSPGARRPPGRDVVFLVDVSGSMSGEPLEHAKMAMRLCLRHLVEGDRFNVLAFSDCVHPLWPDLVPFTQRSLEEADARVSAMDTIGGTEMLEPLLRAATLLRAEGKDRLCVLLTDGQVGNEAEILEQTLGAAKGVRFYTFGIGFNVSDLLLKDLARRTEGASAFIHPGERIDDTVTATFARATAERVSNVEVRFEGVEVFEHAPAALPPLVDGEPWMLLGRYSQPGIGRIEIRGARPGGERFYLEVPVELPASGERPGLEALWAAARIRDWEEDPRGQDGRRAAAMKARIVALAKAHKVSSRFTSFVVVEERSGDRRVMGAADVRPVPVHAPAGFAPPMLLPAGRAPAFPPSLGPPPPPRATAAAPFQARTRAAPLRAASFAAPSPPAPFAPPAPAAKRAERGRGAGDDAGDPIRDLFARQLASGRWPAAGSSSELASTASALAACRRAGIDASHAVYGVPLRKAVESLAEAFRAGAEPESDLVTAFLAAWLVASQRLRARLLSAAASCPRAALRALASAPPDDATAESRLAALLSAR